MLLNPLARRQQQGATLIEVLVTLLVFSVGLLGMAGLQSMSLKANHSAYYRSQATFLAYDIGERMRSNRESALDGDYSSADFPDSEADHEVTGNIVQRDLAEWRNQLASTLPQGTGKVSVVDRMVTIEVRWDDSRGTTQQATGDLLDDEQTFTYRTGL